MIQNVTLRGDYLYQMAQLCIINSTKGERGLIILRY